MIKDKDNKPFTVSITKEGSKKALPAIWYGGREGQWFNVIKSKQWPSVYEVINGKYIGKVIDPKDCEKITILLNSDIQSNGASPMQPDSSTSANTNKSYSELQSENEQNNIAATNLDWRVSELQEKLKEKEDEIKLLEEREVLWSNKHELLNDEILKYKALAEDKDNFAISFAVWAMYDPYAKELQATGITAGQLLEKYKDRPFVDPSQSEKN